MPKIKYSHGQGLRQLAGTDELLLDGRLYGHRRGEVAANTTAGTYALTAKDSGKIINLGTLAASTIKYTLPSAATSAGVSYTFMITVDWTGTGVLDITVDGTDYFFGNVIANKTPVKARIGQTRQTVKATNASATVIIGDFITVTCTGEYWEINGYVKGANIAFS